MKEELTLNVSRIWAIGMHQVTPVNTSSTSEWAFEKEGCAERAWGGNLWTAQRTPLQWEKLN